MIISLSLTLYLEIHPQTTQRIFIAGTCHDAMVKQARLLQKKKRTIREDRERVLIGRLSIMASSTETRYTLR